MVAVPAGWGWGWLHMGGFPFNGKGSAMSSLIGALAEGSPRKPAELVELLKPAARVACERERRVTASLTGSKSDAPLKLNFAAKRIKGKRAPHRRVERASRSCACRLSEKMGHRMSLR